jgi:hypothetical protein
MQHFPALLSECDRNHVSRVVDMAYSFATGEEHRLIAAVRVSSFVCAAAGALLLAQARADAPVLQFLITVAVIESALTRVESTPPCPIEWRMTHE